jgi:hypothetical protein
MSSPDDAKDAQNRLHNYRLKVLGPVDLQTGVGTLGFTFNITSCSIHNPQSKGHSYLHEEMSSASRIAFDTQRATELCILLDEDKAIPVTQDITAVLKCCGTAELCAISPTYKLDLVLAYLRRVHLVSYYAARKFRDEAQLLSFAPEVVYRKSSFVPVLLRHYTCRLYV